MGGASSYLAILAIAGFLASTWLATKVSRFFGVSSIVLEIATGVVLGPRLVGLMSEEYAMCEYKIYHNCDVPDDWKHRLEAGLSLGSDIDRMAQSGLCPYEAYFHDGGHHGAHHGEHANVSEGGHDEEEHGEEHVGEDHHAEEHHGGEDGEVDHGDTSAGGHRRLAGGGSVVMYDSYDECLRKSCNAEVSHHCGLTPDVFTLIGHAGVALMIFESGMHFDFDKAMIVGPKACVVAVLGTVLPLISGLLLMMVYGYPLLPDAISVGTALAPTSVGIALRLLGEAGVLQHDFGQAIITAAFVDDILSLVLFNVLFSLQGEFNAMDTVIKPIIGVVFMGVAMVLAVKVWPSAINDYILPRLPKKPGSAKVSADDEGLFLIMFSVLVVYATITHFLGTHLWGCFIAGMSFACVDKEEHSDHAHHVWVRQTKRYTSWMIRIFFSCTVAFSIPISELLSIEAFIKGSLMGIGPCVLTKVLCAPFMGKAKFVIGWAMVGRAEFAYLIAQMAAAANMIDEKTFSICIWALLYATIFAPFVFRYVLNKYVKEEGLLAEKPKLESTGLSPIAAATAPEPTQMGKADDMCTFGVLPPPISDSDSSPKKAQKPKTQLNRLVTKLLCCIPLGGSAV